MDIWTYHINVDAELSYAAFIVLYQKAECLSIYSFTFCVSASQIILLSSSCLFSTARLDAGR